MKIIVLMMMLFAAFSAVVLADKSIEDAALDTVMDRDDDKKECIGHMGWCAWTDGECCEGYRCKLWCRKIIDWLG
uniref:Mu-Sparatoxin-Hp2 n=1 Tax=Heteropoda pingtungensis TaxID=2926465 RepID=TX2_HETPN|nr:RecName: Full=Mu-Sparatoxin-Hp2; AltName: Full=HptTx-133; Flags: Precursor [Heteropoda pingtungensis]UNJ19549.1 Tx-133 [Heteropoda pingtungensis]